MHFTKKLIHLVIKKMYSASGRTQNSQSNIVANLRLFPLSPLNTLKNTKACPTREITPGWASFNEILAEARMKSAMQKKSAFADEIKSTHREPRFHPTEGRISSSKMISPTRKGGFS